MLLKLQCFGPLALARFGGSSPWAASRETPVRTGEPHTSLRPRSRRRPRTDLPTPGVPLDRNFSQVLADHLGKFYIAF